MDTTRLLDEIDEGFIYIDKEGIVKAYNQVAKEITGVVFQRTSVHPEGRIEKGDLVVIADNRMGYDDGNLTVEDLNVLNLPYNDLKLGDAFIAVGIYGDDHCKGIVKNWRNKAINRKLKHSGVFEGYFIEVNIDVVGKSMEIVIDHVSYIMHYTHAVGHMVVIDGKTGALKFHQARGYTIRKETIRDLLSQKKFRSKVPNEESYEVLNKKIGDIFEYNELLSKIYDSLNGKGGFFDKAFYQINKRPTLCTLQPIGKSNAPEGVVLKIVDVSNLEVLMMKRNEILMKMEMANESLLTEARDGVHEMFEKIIGSSQPMQHVMHLAYKASKSRSTILITGESGTGKSLIAKEIHKLQGGKSKPFISVNCTAIPNTLFESELFGYEKGAFTGAERTGKKGFFELASGGTIFLDEIGELPLDVQSKLLHVLQHKSFYKVGALQPTHVNVRVIAATNVNLEEAISERRFREDLYYRINVFPIEMPPLRDRKTDLYPLIRNIMEKLSEEIGIPVKDFSGEALDKMVSYDWPGNVRELENVIERAMNISDADIIESECITINVKRETKPLNMKEQLQEIEKQMILEALERNEFRHKETYEMLGLSRSVYYEKLKKYDISKS
ncbi:sigma-54 interaction domain-containing protein [Fusibacter ferrireducens]|uniref:Sigma 54-interacting transcriptional regulator n=1 Tax=Fusibacter ferrireducens TaxID=2785058 RepID=A0ABR9ZZZ5_9FIRM|nr:sigma 54-interacting transcriptional regulator [Fusibacter ferrireducens]MBF4695194.1 sigma 54-interacting transcriptional regulator [Fusibacter ferrireducens]